MEINRIRCVSNAVGVLTSAAMIVPTVRNLVPALQELGGVIIESGPKTGVDNILTCLGAGLGGITLLALGSGLILGEAALGYIAKKVTESAYKYFEKNKFTQQPMQNLSFVRCNCSCC